MNNAKESNLKQIMNILGQSFPYASLEFINKKLEDPMEFEGEERLAIIERNKRLIERHMNAIKSMFGLNETTSQSFIENRSNFTSQEWEAIRTFKQEINEYQNNASEVISKEKPVNVYVGDDGQEGTSKNKKRKSWMKT
ncbi:hypothetical protein N9N03_00085 [Chlamydiia bacterium]|nr:hypothetical protein [Chlamydiia bacterium]